MHSRTRSSSHSTMPCCICGNVWIQLLTRWCSTLKSSACAYDGSVKIAEEYAAADGRFRVVKLWHAGVDPLANVCPVVDS